MRTVQACGKQGGERLSSNVLSPLPMPPEVHSLLGIMQKALR